MTRHSPDVNRRSASFVYRGKRITFYFYVQQQANVSVDTVLFLGTGQVGKIPGWVAANVPAGVVVVEGLPHWESDPSGDDLVEFSLLYTQSAYEAILQLFNQTSMHIIGSSQAAPGTIWLANNNPERVKNIALVLPMGLNTIRFGSDDKTRLRELRKRWLQSMMQKDQLIFGDTRNAYISLNLIRILLAGISDGSTVKKYAVGISQDMTQPLHQLVNTQKRLGRKLMVYVGARDKVFPASEIHQTLEAAGIHDVTIITAPNISHGSLATRKHRSFLAQVVGDIRNQ